LMLEKGMRAGGIDSPLDVDMLEAMHNHKKNRKKEAQPKT